MTDTPDVEHLVAVGGAIVMGALSLLAWASGDKEGRQIQAQTKEDAKSSAVAASVGGAAGAGLIDLNAYRAVIDGLDAIVKRLDAMDSKLARMVEFGENQDERDERERQHRDLKSDMREMLEELRADIARGDERRARAKPSTS